MLAPTVAKIPPTPDLPRDHHGPPAKPLASLQETAAPKYFRNPWPSYRTASMWDAYQAYQRGASIAPHPSFFQGNRFFDGEEPYRDQEEDDYESEPIWTESDSIKKRKIYIRPEFSDIRPGDEKDDWRDPPVGLVEPDWGGNSKTGERVTWLGHAGVLVQIPWRIMDQEQTSRGGATCGILFDPIFSYRCSPTQYIGPARYMDPPCSVSMLPEIHICCISHDHYDHLDYNTIMDLWKYHQATIHFFVPIGLKPWFTASGIPYHRVTELDWWREAIVSFEASPDVDYDPHYPPDDYENKRSIAEDLTKTDTSALTLKVAFTPAQHRSGRSVLDHMTTLWGSWCVGVVEAADAGKVLKRGMNDWKGFKIYFGGDTGYRYASAPEGDSDAICPAFQQIADYYAPFNLALLPLSTGSSLPFLRTVLSLSLDQYILTSSLHCSPADSLDIHLIIKSERTLGIHWGTFCDADEARGTRVDFGRCRRSYGVSPEWDTIEAEKGRFVITDIGQTLIFPTTKDDN
ncbi:hypothetical protein CNBA2030 [Cryptococcus deneoformans B-3501A]|uniref:hypothetical protein n=1 Tax=Cryptococcus deneoformans (strain B-3501A) TaxID=283643 RepID=UPI000042E347|nr:hypothetical protein CNBA2030 [Cryptococcus neoformans var. neoformans B-3501A]EAL23556.1 hypothetical protein CNBA2030 [Cryptococcus neoformans var. neoformans B-3501A]